MSEIVKVILAGAAGTFIAAAVGPKVAAHINVTTETQKKLLDAGIAGGSAGIAFWLIRKVG